jgi:outer membrane lipoprotein-sorting protein
MRRMILILVGMVAIAAKAQDADALVKLVADKLAKVQDYKASAMLKTNVPFIRIPESEVDVYYKRPDKFRIKKEGGVSVLPKGGVSINLNSLLAGNKFTAVPGGDASVGGQVVKVIKLLPQDENSEVVLTTLYIDEKKQLIKKSTTTTRDNGTYEMEMEYGKYANWGLPDKVVFTFNTKNYSLPKGMTLDYEGSDKPPVNKTGKDTKGRIEVKYSSYTVNKGVGDDVFKK